MPLTEREAKNRRPRTGNQGLYSPWLWVWEGEKETGRTWGWLFRPALGRLEIRDTLVCSMIGTGLLGSNSEGEGG